MQRLKGDAVFATTAIGFGAPAVRIGPFTIITITATGDSLATVTFTIPKPALNLLM
jgi:hypothetical protein